MMPSSKQGTELSQDPLRCRVRTRSQGPGPEQGGPRGLSRYQPPAVQSFPQRPRHSGLGLLSSWKRPIPSARPARPSCVSARRTRQCRAQARVDGSREGGRPHERAFVPLSPGGRAARPELPFPGAAQVTSSPAGLRALTLLLSPCRTSVLALPVTAAVGRTVGCRQELFLAGSRVLILGRAL